MWAVNLFNLRTDANTSQVLGGMVTGSLLPLLGVQPVLGRNFTPEDERQHTVILGDALWRTRFGADPAVLGRHHRSWRAVLHRHRRGSGLVSVSEC